MAYFFAGCEKLHIFADIIPQYMKRIFYFLAIFLSMAASAWADSLEYGFSTTRISATSLYTEGMNYDVAIEVPEEVAGRMTGASVTAISFGFGSSASSKDVILYLSYEPGGEPFYTEAARVSVNRLLRFELATPYVIEGKRFYAGYKYQARSSSGSPLTFTGNVSGANPCFDNVGHGMDSETMTWEHWGSRQGNLNLSLTIEGEDLPKAYVMPEDVTVAEWSAVGEEFDVTFSFRNFGSAPVSEIDVEYVVGSAEAQTRKFHMEEPLAPGQTGTVTFPVSSMESTVRLPIIVSVTSVDGVSNLGAGDTVRTTMVNSDDLSPRMVVVEEFTGVSCGFCPAGWIALKMLHEAHPESVVNIAVHNYNTRHELACPSYEEWRKKYITTAPQAVANRSGAAFSPNPVGCENRYKALQGLVAASVEVSAQYADSGHTTLMVDTRTCFADDFSNLDYGIAWVLTEDNLGPYMQTNNYAGGNSGNMFGFEDMPNPVSLMYDHVARDIFNWDGLPEAVPSDIRKGESYSYSRTIPIMAPLPERGHIHYNVIALLIDRESGEIVNAATCRIADAVEPEITGLESADVESSRIAEGGDGIIRIFGAEGCRTMIYRIDGSMVADICSDATVPVAPGLYIVKAGNHVCRVMAR